MTTIKDNLVKLSIEDLMFMDIGAREKKIILKYCMGNELEVRLERYCGSLILSQDEFDFKENGISSINSNAVNAIRLILKS
jgi:hypothetical protein